MQTRLLPNSRVPILECVDSVVDLEDALTIVAASYEKSTDRLLLRGAQLPPEFFDLQTGFAGEFIQKLVNYRIVVAGIFNPGASLGERFQEYIREAKRGRQFRSFDDEDSAIAWLEAQP